MIRMSALHKGGFHFLKGTYKKAAVGCFTRVLSDRTTGNGLELKKGKFRLALGRNSLL